MKLSGRSYGTAATLLPIREEEAAVSSFLGLISRYKVTIIGANEDCISWAGSTRTPNGGRFCVL